LRRLSALLLLASILMVTFSLVTSAQAGDPTGSRIPGDTLHGQKVAIDMGWMLIMGSIVWFMQLGFAFLGAGVLRSKNQVNYWTKSYIDFSIGVVVFMMVGFALMFGGSKLYPGLEQGNQVIGWSGFLLAGDAYDVSTLAFFFWQAVFAATSVTIVAGMVAERLKFTAYMAYTVLVNMVMYPIYGHWVWGGGWLATLPFGVGVRDFAGSGVVHALGGFTGLAAALLLGPRIGKYDGDGKPRVFPGHNIPYAVAGTFILFFGWFAFNGGSTLAATDLRTSVIMVNTYLAGGAGATAMALLTYAKYRRADTLLICNGALGGLVAVTASCAYIAPWAAVVIGLVAGPIVWAGNWLVEWKFKIDDPVGAFGVHGVCGAFGLIAVGIFADGTYGGVEGLILGKTGQIVAQLIDAGVVISFSFAMGLLIFAAIKYTIGLRVGMEEELSGLDIGEHGYSAYPEYVIAQAQPEEVLKNDEED